MHLVETRVDGCRDDLDFWERPTNGIETLASDEESQEDDIGFCRQLSCITNTGVSSIWDTPGTPWSSRTLIAITTYQLDPVLKEIDSLLAAAPVPICRLSL